MYINVLSSDRKSSLKYRICVKEKHSTILNRFIAVECYLLSVQVFTRVVRVKKKKQFDSGSESDN